jgi:hypothetical protein
MNAILATFADATGTWAKGLAALAAGFAFYWAGRPGPSSALDVRRLYWYLAAGLFLAGTGLIFWAFAVTNCPPDSYECPI